MGKITLLKMMLSILLASAIGGTASAKSLARLDLSGYADEQGAISIQYKGATVDPYFTLQALLLARENGLDISTYAKNWANWLVTRQKLDGTFDRYCLSGAVWGPCKTADADDALMAIWMKFLNTMPAELKANPAWQKSFRQSSVTLKNLINPANGIYLVSPVYQHGLFMDNLEVLSYEQQPDNPEQSREAKKLAGKIHTVFWDDKDHRFLVSTQPEQKNAVASFYPDHVAQIYPLLFDFTLLPADRKSYYQQWIKKYRALWLQQSHDDFSWGLIAVIAFQQGDQLSASCWLRETLAAQRTTHWIVTDEVARQVLTQHNIKPALNDVDCH